MAMMIDLAAFIVAATYEQLLMEAQLQSEIRVLVGLSCAICAMDAGAQKKGLTQ